MSNHAEWCNALRYGGGPCNCKGEPPLRAAAGSAEHPQCEACQREMTPENSKRCPKLFLCDDCSEGITVIGEVMLKRDWLRLHRENQSMRKEIDGLKAKLLVERIKSRI